MRRLASHWPEYLTEAACLGLFMMSAAACATLLQHPASPLSHWTAAPFVQRIPMGLAMGITASGIIYSPLGRRSGAHMNPAVTLAFYRLRKIAGSDAAAYVVAQFVGGVAGILAGEAMLGGLPAHPSVNHIATMPGPAGAGVAFISEGVISFGMMLMVLSISNHAKLARFTGLGAGALVAAYIVVEAPFSGMSMNPARTFGPALLAHSARTLWIYFLAPPIGMLAAAELFVRLRGREFVRCAKLHHRFDVRCIFHCGYAGTHSD